MKRVTSLLLAGALTLGLCAPAMAAEPDAGRKAADAFYGAGLFNGYGSDSNGKPIYGLDGTVTRAQGTVMLVRLLNEEKYTADFIKRCGGLAPEFADAPAWCADILSYACDHGYVNGTSATTFAPDAPMSGTAYLTLCLRALGYTDGKDFTWDAPQALAERLGIIEPGAFADPTAPLTRGDLARISYNTMNTNLAGRMSKWTLAQSKNIDLNHGYDSTRDFTAAELVEFNIARKTEELDIDDQSILLVDMEGNYWYSVRSAPVGTIFVKDGLERTGGTAGDDINHFFDMYERIDSNSSVDRDSGELEIYGAGTVRVTNEDGQFLITTPDLGSNWYPIQATGGRVLSLNTLTYFGGDMGKAVWCMMDDHYWFSEDNDKPISAELAAKYGLTIQNTSVNTEFGMLGDLYLFQVSATVSNGKETWQIVYYLEHLISHSFIKVTIPA